MNVQMHKSAVNHSYIEVEAQVHGVDSENESRNLRRAQIIWAAVPTSRVPGPRARSGPVFVTGAADGEAEAEEGRFEIMEANQIHAEKTIFGI